MKYLHCASMALTAIVLISFSVNSKAESSSSLSELAEVEKLVTSKQFQEMQESIMMNSTDKDSKAAVSTIKTIRNLALKRQVNKIAQAAADKVIEAILMLVRLVSVIEHLTNKVLDEVKKLSVEDSAAATDLLTKTFKSLADRIHTFGVPIEDAHGFALAVAGGSNQEALKKSMTTLQNGGSAILESLKIAEELVSTGIKAGGIAVEDGFKAGREDIDVIILAAYEYAIKSAKYVLGIPIIPVLNEDSRVSGIMKSLKSDVSIDSPAALAAIYKLKNLFKSKLSSSTRKSSINAANIMMESLCSTILETAEALEIVKKAIQKAGKLALQDPEAAIAAVLEAIRTAKAEIKHGATIGFLGFGAAREVAGNIPLEGLIPAMVEIIMGRIEVMNDMKKVEPVITFVFRAGGTAVESAVNAASQILNAAGSTLYAQYVDAGEMGINVFLDN